MVIATRKEGEATLIDVVNEAGLRFILCDYGAGIYRLTLDDKELLIGEKDLSSWMSSTAYYGKIIGRVAGRIRGGALEFEGERYPLSTNEGDNVLHGGPNGYSFRYFSFRINEDNPDYINVIFSIDSPDGDGGFIGAVHTDVTYRIYRKEARFAIYFDSSSDKKTPLSLTSHCYFNLGGYMDVANHSLMVNSSRTTKYDEKLIPLCLEEVPSCLDFRSLRSLEEVMDSSEVIALPTGGIDHAFELDDNKGVSAHLESPFCSLDILTDFPSIVIYADNGGSPERLLNTGYHEKKHSGLAMEPEYIVWDYEAMSVTPKKHQHNYIEYRFERR